MPEFFLELFSEEIPARMQVRAAEDLARLLEHGFLHEIIVDPGRRQVSYGPRRIAYCVTVRPQTPGIETKLRGPRVNAPAQALDGFLRKVNATKEQITQSEGYWVFEHRAPPISAVDLIASVLPPLLRRFPWPKSMR